jgi:transketolase
LKDIPNLDMMHPADYKETMAVWKSAMANLNRPTVLILSRQGFPIPKQVNVIQWRSGVEMVRTSHILK